MKSNKKRTVNKTGQDKIKAESIEQMAGKILDSALCLMDKRIAFATRNGEVLDDLSDYIEALDKDEMSKTEKNYLIKKISDLKLIKISDIASVISMCRDKLGHSSMDDECDEIVFLIDYGDEQKELSVKEGFDED